MHIACDADANARAKAKANDAQAMIAHSASVGDCYWPRNGFIELHVLTMGLADFMVRLAAVEGVKEVTLMDKVKLMSGGWGLGPPTVFAGLLLHAPKQPC